MKFLTWKVVFLLQLCLPPLSALRRKSTIFHLPSTFLKLQELIVSALFSQAVCCSSDSSFKYHFNLSLSTGFTLEWQTHLVKPIHKSGDCASGFNYHPTALLPVISKVLERIVYNRLIDVVGANLSFSQFGFLPYWSTVQQMLTMLADIYHALDELFIPCCSPYLALSSGACGVSIHASVPEL